MLSASAIVQQTGGMFQAQVWALWALMRDAVQQSRGTILRFQVSRLTMHDATQHRGRVKLEFGMPTVTMPRPQRTVDIAAGVQAHQKNTVGCRTRL